MHKLLFFCLVILTAAVYAVGLDGPFLFDDTPNILRPMQAWLNGKTGWQELVFGNRSGPLGRGLSMLTFVANGATTGLAVVPFKLTNLVIHIMCGGLLYMLLAIVLQRDRILAPHRHMAALAVTAVWLLHPMQVSTVLYVVQRMAQLSALFSLAALLLYVLGRVALEERRLRSGTTFLFVFVPLCTVAAILSKENGALVPLLCAAIELAYFRPAAGARRPRAVRWFYVLSLALPFVIALWVFSPSKLVAGYEGRLFTLGERLLSQPRALMDYAGALLVPTGPALGVYTDDFIISRSLLSPLSTIWAIAGLLIWSVAAIAFRKQAQAFFCGSSLFFLGHLMESSVFPLELYFEHRNYLPSVGFFLAVAGLLGWLMTASARNESLTRLPRILKASFVVYIALVAGATWARSTVWSSFAAIAEQGVISHPKSRRAHLDQLSVLLAKGQNADARKLLEHMLDMEDSAAQHAAIFTLPWLDCRENLEISEESIQRMHSIIGQKLELAELFASEKLGNILLKQECLGLPRVQHAHMLRELTAETQQDPRLVQIWRIRLMASRLFAAEGQLPLAIEQAALAWMTGTADVAAGGFLANLYFANDEPDSARLIVQDVAKRLKSWDQRNIERLHLIVRRFDGPEAADQLLREYGLPHREPLQNSTNTSTDSDRDDNANP